MQIRSLSVAVTAGLALTLVGSSTATASEAVTSPASGTAASETFKSSAMKRAKLTARAGAAAKAAVVTAPPAAAPVSYSDQVLALTNHERVSRGLRALAFSSCADGYADSWAAALARAGSLSHQALLPILSACSARSVGENVAYGNVTPEQLVKMWMDSPGHRANILNAGFTHLGVGDLLTSTGRVYAVQVFLTL